MGRDSNITDTEEEAIFSPFPPKRRRGHTGSGGVMGRGNASRSEPCVRRRRRPHAWKKKKDGSGRRQRCVVQSPIDSRSPASGPLLSSAFISGNKGSFSSSFFPCHSDIRFLEIAASFCLFLVFSSFFCCTVRLSSGRPQGILKFSPRLFSRRRTMLLLLLLNPVFQ